MVVFLLLAAIALVSIPTGLIAYFQVGINGVWATVLAASVCSLGGGIAFALQFLLRDPKFLLAQILVGFLLRMGLPLVTCFILYGINSPLAKAGFVYCLMPIYGVLLAVETLTLLATMPNNEPAQAP